MLSVLADGSHCQMQPFAILAPMSAEKERTTPSGARTSPFCSCTLVIFQAIETALTRIQYLKMIVCPLPFFVKQIKKQRLEASGYGSLSKKPRRVCRR